MKARAALKARTWPSWERAGPSSFQDNLMGAPLTAMVSADRRAYACGVFSAAHGVSWFLGSTLLGVLYDRSLVALVVFSVLIQLAAIPVLVATGRRPGRRA